ncbi:PDDEXK nuclease domain-containing protein [Phocaeicola vulgatus]|uniref:PDDEXK nuclease domain-containing protein n=2 Tax=Bacteroidales TaxID=171549 RepID=A0ABD4WJ25_BACUN|nr:MULTISPECIES: PDDEXK nuclease domain-containing protein [Bacteroidaceae]MCS2750958.1 PDDEXK nuclease domain-containing protein [Phocaeicola vulgatus]MDB1054594.1 PDDEXK nuclease domain-containing protein [Phocaeicola vulgatus]MDB1061858.1 PDDEXK nuclease domain-containing protein [Phocaeicola vulgatus]MDC1787589.1 PDDEXK nuclease domain-containing protein [Bacteroides uniformis]MDC1791381.1 PDDEXK nuclease domain-containing protein [Bacteroides uniformis]
MEQLANSIQSISFEQLAQKIITVDDSMRGVAVKTINQATTLRNWIIGCYIVEYEQNGSDRAKYGDNLLKSLEKRIGQKGLNVTLFQLSRLFYRDYPHIGTLVSANHATVLHKLPLSEIYATVSHKLPEIDSFAVNKKNAGKLSEQFNTPPENLVSALSFSHIRELLTIEDPLVRFFYETECIRGTWSVRELRRQIVSNLHIRIGLSEDKMKAMMLADSKAERHTPLLQIRDPYTFEFLGLQAKDVVTESDIEEALLGHLQEFLLELGKGFCFEARQKRIIIDGEYYFADLVFYNRLLHCNVIVELKNDEFRHEHIGQLNAYVSYYAENEMQPGDNPPVGILLCTHKGKKMVEYALGSMDNHLFVSTYQLQLPNRQQLEQFLMDECREQSSEV